MQYICLAEFWIMCFAWVCRGYPEMVCIALQMCNVQCECMIGVNLYKCRSSFPAHSTHIENVCRASISFLAYLIFQKIYIFSALLNIQAFAFAFAFYWTSNIIVNSHLKYWISLFDAPDCLHINVFTVVIVVLIRNQILRIYAMPFHAIPC